KIDSVMVLFSTGTFIISSFIKSLRQKVTTSFSSILLFSFFEQLLRSISMKTKKRYKLVLYIFLKLNKFMMFKFLFQEYIGAFPTADGFLSLIRGLFSCFLNTLPENLNIATS